MKLNCKNKFISSLFWFICLPRDLKDFINKSKPNQHTTQKEKR